MYADSEDSEDSNLIIHVQWFVASSQTMMGEISDPQELFIIDLCGDLESVDAILGNFMVRDSPSQVQRGALEEFYCQ